MKKRLSVLIGLLPLLTMAQEGKFTISGKVAGNENCGVLLARFVKSVGQAKDTTFVVNGRFSFTGSVSKERQLAQVIIYGLPEKSMLFYLEPGKIELDNSKTHYTIGGTPLNKELQRYHSVINALLDSVNATRAADKKVTMFNPEIQLLKLNVTKKYIQQHPSSEVALDDLSYYGSMVKDADALESAYNLFTPALKKTAKGVELITKIKGMRATHVGNPAPLFSLPDTEGKEVSLTDFKGKYVLVDFWATWCGPCMAEMPNVKKAYEEFKGRNFEILGVSLDRPDAKDKWLQTIRQDGLDWKQVSDLKFWNSKVVPLYNLESIPANFLIDPQGKIIAMNLRGKALAEKLAEVLN